MSKRLIWLASFVLVLGLASNAFAAVPVPWGHRDIGVVGAAGDASYTGTGAFTVVGDGGDIWDATDRFHYVYMPLSYDGEIQARVTSLQQTNDWAKAGVMIREQLTDTSSMAMMIATPPGGTNLFSFQWVNGTTRRQNADGGAITAFPVWVKIVRSGNNFTGYYAPDNAGSAGAWVQESMQTIPMATKVYIGLCLTSHSDGVLCTATFDNVTVLRPQQGMAISPIPPDGAMVDAEEVSLTWEPGDLAVSHDVYFSDNFSAVNTATTSSGGVYKGRQSQLKYPPGPYTEPVVRGTTYYWRIDEVAGTNVWRGDIWSFTVMPKEAWGPTPPDGDTMVQIAPNVLLSWHLGDVPSGYRITYPLYYSTSKTAVDTGTTPNVTVSTTSRSLGGLSYNTTYYWRADTRLNNMTPPFLFYKLIKGKTWSFTTAPPGFGSILREIWEGITPTGVAISLLYNWPDFPSNPTTSVLIPAFDTEPGLDNYGGRIHGWVLAPVSGEYTFYLASDENGELWLSTDENPANAQLIAYENSWTGDKAWQYGPEMSAPIPLVGGNKYYISALWKEGGGGDNCAVGWTGPGISTITVIPGRYLMPYVRLWAQNPSPRNNTTMVPKTVALTWTPGDNAASHKVWFGTDPNAMQLVATKPLGDETCDPGPLELDTTYYWRIDEVNDTDPDSPWTGRLWRFTTSFDCNGNGIPDEIDIATGTSRDCNGNAIPDECDIANGTSLDCNRNGIPDECDIADGTSQDSNRNGIPDECEIDCNGNGIPDKIDIATGTSRDCNGNGIPDECDIANGTSLDCNGNGIPDECDDETGSILREIWEGVTPDGSQVLSDLYNWPDFPYNPTTSVLITQFDTEPGLDNYGGRIHGWLCAPVSGDYTFYIATDDNGELWLSTDDNPANAQLIAYEDSWTGPRGWQTGTEMSAPIPLVGGNKYYISALWKEAFLGDNCAVGWTGPGISTITVIPGGVLMPYVVQYWAYDPIPANGSTGVSTTPTLDWVAGRHAASHDVYFGTSYDDVEAGTDGTYKGNQPLADHDYVPPAALEAAKIYYWKITEVNDLHADKKWEGPVWAFRVASGAGGLLGSYYHHTGGASPAGFETFVLSRTDPEINFNWGDPGSPDPSVNVDHFTCRWQGQVEAQFSEDYIFYTASDDGARLWVDGQLVINQWIDHDGTTEVASAPISLVAGQKYDIVMEHYENEGAAAAYLRWSSPSTCKRIIPSIWLWPYTDVRIVPVAVLIDPASTTEVRTTLPASIEAVVRGGKYYLEIWASDIGATKTGLTGVYVDVSFCGQTSASGVEHGTVFTMFTDGDIQTAGVDEFGGSTFSSGVGAEPNWVRIGWIEMSAVIDAPACSISLLASTGGVAAYGEGLVPWAFIGLGSLDLQILPPARSYNLDGDSVIGVGDLSLFAPSWQRSVPPAQNAHDFDCDCFVGVGDLSWFATGWSKSPADPTILYPPCPGGGSCGEAASMHGMAPRGFTLTSLRPMATTSSGPVDVDVAFELVVLNAPSASGTTTLLPASIGSIAQGQTYYVEVWASDVGDISTGITSAYVDLHFPAAAAGVTNVSHGSLFTLFPAGSIGLGVIDELGGSQLSPGVGVAPQWARVAVIRMRADAAPPSVTFSLSPSSTKVAAYGRGVIDWDDIALGAASVPPKITGFVRTPRAAGLDGVLLFADSGGGSSLTDATGYYEVVVPQGWSGAVTPGSAEFSLSFDPDALSYSNVTNIVSDQDYAARNVCDLDGDDDVTIVDFAYFADYWLQSGAELPANFDLSDAVGYPDLEIFIKNWLWTP